MNIFDKIEKIRQKPEHVRMRYVWGAVAISMVFIITVWIFSMTASFKGEDSPAASDPLSDIKKQYQDYQQTTPSLQDYTDKPLTTGSTPSSSANVPAVQYPNSASALPQNTDAPDQYNSTPSSGVTLGQ